jgi:hypothetical protein
MAEQWEPLAPGKYHAYAYTGMGGGITRWTGEAHDAGDAAARAAAEHDTDSEAGDQQAWTVVQVTGEVATVHVRLASVERRFEVMPDG